MVTVCAWCKAPLPGSAPGSGPVSHGICDTCRVDVEYRRQPLRTLLDALPAAVMAVDVDGNVVDGNARLMELVGKSSAQITGRGGDVISCIYAALPGGCGRTTHCVGCTIRRAVNDTRASGEPRTGVPAFAYVRKPDGEVVKLDMMISTERVGALVLLRVDDAVVGPPGGADVPER
jgi:PAS domain-containing protein